MSIDQENVITSQPTSDWKAATSIHYKVSIRQCMDALLDFQRRRHYLLNLGPEQLSDLIDIYPDVLNPFMEKAYEKDGYAGQELTTETLEEIKKEARVNVEALGMPAPNSTAFAKFVAMCVQHEAVIGWVHMKKMESTTAASSLQNPDIA